MSLDPQIGRRWLFLRLPLMLAVVVLSGIIWLKFPQRGPVIPAGARQSIHQFLSSKTGQREFKPAFDFELAGQVWLLRSNVNALEARSQSIRAAQRALDDENAPHRLELEALRAEVAKLKQAAGDARGRLKAAGSAGADPKEIAALQSDYEKKDRDWKARREQAGASETQVKAQIQTRLEALEREQEELERQREAARVALGPRSEELSGQENRFIRQCRERAEAARNYEELYVLIGEQLTVIDRLLKESDLERQRMAVSVAREACRHASDDAQNGWLAARICEAYFLPNLALADYTAGSNERAQDMLRTCKSVFSGVEEADNLVKSCELMIAQASTSRGADNVRVEVSDWLAQRSDYQRALKFLGEIQDPEVSRLVEPKVAQLRQLAASSR